MSGLSNTALKIIILTGMFFSAASSNCLFAEIIPPDRRIAWNPGIPGGIPHYTVIFANVHDYGAAGDGIADDAPAIQNAINACPVGQVVYIPEGIYRLNSGLEITKGIVLRGAGANKTFLKAYNDSIRIGNWNGGTFSNYKTSISGNLAKGDFQITVTDASAFPVGSYIVIDQLNDNIEVFNTHNETWLGRNDAGDDGPERTMGQMTKVTVKIGNVLTIDPPLYHAYSSLQSPEICKVAGSNSIVQYAGLEDFYIELSNNQSGGTTIYLLNSAFCWIKNIESYKCGSAHVLLGRCFRCEVRDSYFHHAFGYGGGGSGYGIRIAVHTSDSLVENNIFYFLRHAMVPERGPAGNVFGYNYSAASYMSDGATWLAGDIEGHGSHPHMNLFEGNMIDQIYMDDTHGSASYSTFFRNHSIRDSAIGGVTSFLNAVAVESHNYYHNFVGNIWGQPTQTWTAYEDNGTRSNTDKYVYIWGYPYSSATTSTDPKSNSTALRHGNFDYASQSAKWDPGISDHVLPPSLYLSQKPLFFGSLAWPPFGPDCNPLVGSLPAKERFESITAPTPTPIPTSAIPLTPEVTSTPTPTILLTPVADASNVRVFPNPASEYVGFHFEPQASISIQIRIFNLSGGLVSQVSGTISPGRRDIIWNTKQLATGVYIYQIYQNGAKGKSGRICVTK